MPLDVEIPVLRGFLTPSEATRWKQSVFSSTAGETVLVCLVQQRSGFVVGCLDAGADVLVTCVTAV